MDIEKLRTFITIVKCGSFNKAAEQTGYTQAGISYIANAVEEELGMKMLERTYNGVRLNADGQAVYNDIEKTVDAYHNLINAVHTQKDQNKGRLRVASIDSMSIQWLPQATALLNERNPDLQVDTITGDPFEINDWLRDGTADVALTEHLWASGDYIWIELTKDPFYGIFPKDSPVSGHCTMRDFDRKDFFIPDFRRDQNVRIMIREAKIQVHYMYDRASTPSIIKRIARGTGVSLMNALAIELCSIDLSKPGEIPKILPLNPPMYRELGISVKTDRREDPSIQDFVRCMKKVIAEDDGWKEQTRV